MSARWVVTSERTNCVWLLRYECKPLDNSAAEAVGRLYPLNASTDREETVWLARLPEFSDRRVSPNTFRTIV